MITVVETSIFFRRAAALLTEDEHRAVIDRLAADPLAGDEIVGTGGVRKLRFAARGKGKSGGVRVIYYFVDAATPVYALFIYGKGEQADPTAAQRRRLTMLAASLKAERRPRRIK